MLLPLSEACERNKGPILEILRTEFVACHDVLEIGSGTGQHAVYFAGILSHLTWQPTERMEHLRDLSLRIGQSGLPNLRPPRELDVLSQNWYTQSVDGIYSANTLHIMSWGAVEAMFSGIGAHLAPGGRLAIYGPFNEGGRYSSLSNERFDQMLKGRDPASGIRSLEDVSDLARSWRLTLARNHAMPANNRLLVFDHAL